MIWESLLCRASMHSKSLPIKISEFSREIKIVQFRQFLNIKMTIRVYLGQKGLIIFLMIPSSKSQYSNTFQLAWSMCHPLYLHGCHDSDVQAVVIPAKLFIRWHWKQTDMYTLVLFWIRFINAFCIKNEFEGLSFRSTVHRTWWEQSLRGASDIFVLFYLGIICIIYSIGPFCMHIGYKLYNIGRIKCEQKRWTKCIMILLKHA